MTETSRRHQLAPLPDLRDWFDPFTMLDWRPKLDFHPIRVEDRFDSDGAYVLSAEMPGIDPEHDVERPGALPIQLLIPTGQRFPDKRDLACVAGPQRCPVQRLSKCATGRNDAQQNIRLNITARQPAKNLPVPAINVAGIFKRRPPGRELTSAAGHDRSDPRTLLSNPNRHSKPAEPVCRHLFEQVTQLLRRGIL